MKKITSNSSDTISLLAYIERARRSARLTSLGAVFSNLASGKIGAPYHEPFPDPQLLQFDGAVLQYSEVRKKFVSPFNRHFVASIPFILEEQCRLGSAIQHFCVNKRSCSVYTLGDGAGVTSRTLADISKAHIKTLNCSPTPENFVQFRQNLPIGAHFFLGPFFELDLETRRKFDGGIFKDGFDIIIEDTTFQMYGRERIEPIALTKRHLKPGGIMIFIEKLAQNDPIEFERREQQKDLSFKKRFFSDADIAEKQKVILSKMDDQLVTLEALSAAVLISFQYAVITWNSGNFYTVVATDNQDSLRSFVGCLLPPAIPESFQYETLPLALGQSV